MLPRSLSTLAYKTPRGAMKHLITLTSATALDSTGAPGAPTSSAPIWAFISALQGRDLNLAQQTYLRSLIKLLSRIKTETPQP